MSTSLLRSDDADKQRAFVMLLARPVVTPWTDAPTYALVHRHAATLTTWCRRLGYHLAHIDQCYRLRRTPIHGVVAHPTQQAPPRAELLLCLYAAACLDEHRHDSITLQDLSDLVRLSSAGRGGWPYDPNVRRHRSMFVAALAWLITHGVLERRTDDQLREGWEHTGAGIGAGYIIHREALVLCLDAGDVALALDPPPSDDDTRGVRLLRHLIETQALYLHHLSEADRSYWVGQRHRLVSRACEMTGGSVEVRADAVVLSLPPDRDLPEELLLGFPSATACDWAALALIDALAPTAAGTFRTVPAAQVLAHATELHSHHGSRLTVALRESPHALVEAVRHRLVVLGLIHSAEDGAWTLTPLAARYRDASLTGPESHSGPSAERTPSPSAPPRTRRKTRSKAAPQQAAATPADDALFTLPEPT